MLDSRTDDVFRARLSHAVQRRHADEPWPYLSSDDVDAWGSEKLPAMSKQIDNGLRWLADQLEDDSTGWVMTDSREDLTSRVGARDYLSAVEVLTEAARLGYARRKGRFAFGLTSKGWQRLEQTPSVPAKEKDQMTVGAARNTGSKVFIGHGRSDLWLRLKDFIVLKLNLACDEFNAQQSAGLTTKERLEEMLDAAGFAFLVMTAEDETVDGKRTARMNVVHEVGLFQGRLGFRKAIVLLEEGCDEFSNIHGLIQVRFPPGNIRAAFEDVREVLEREGLNAAHQDAPRQVFMGKPNMQR